MPWLRMEDTEVEHASRTRNVGSVKGKTPFFFVSMFSSVCVRSLRRNFKRTLICCAVYSE